MDRKIIAIAAEVLKVSEEEAAKNSKEISEIDAGYFWKPSRGGIAVIINSNGEKLAASSSVNFDAHLQAFRDGKRN